MPVLQECHVGPSQTHYRDLNISHLHKTILTDTDLLSFFFQTGISLIKPLLFIFSGVFAMTSAQVLKHFKLLCYCKISERVKSGIFVALETNLI